MIYRDGNKISAVYHNGKPISKIFRDGKLVWQKNTLVGKRVKSITVSLPAWKTMERQYWQAGIWLVGTSTSGYYIDVSIKGRGIRLRGAGGSLRGSISGSKFVIPEGAALTTDDISVGSTVLVTIKTPAKTYTGTSSGVDGGYKYAFTSTTAVVDGTKLRIKTTLSGGTLIHTMIAKWGMSLRSMSNNTPDILNSSFTNADGYKIGPLELSSPTVTLDWALTQANVITMLGKVSNISSYYPTAIFQYMAGPSTIASATASLITPAFTKTLTLPITAIETY